MKRSYSFSQIDFIEIYTPLANVLAYWHEHALGFHLTYRHDINSGNEGSASYVCESGNIRIVLTSSYPKNGIQKHADIDRFIGQHYCGVKKIALRTTSVSECFDISMKNGAVPIQFPRRIESEEGFIEEASIKLFDDREIVFLNRDGMLSGFKPGYVQHTSTISKPKALFSHIDHIASEVRVNESRLWSEYLTRTIGTNIVQSILPSEDNTSGMLLNVNQSTDGKITFVIAEPDQNTQQSKIQKNIDAFGPGVHHIAFATANLRETATALEEQGVEFVKFPRSYYDLLRGNSDFHDVDIALLEKNGIIIDKEDNTYLLQKFVKPISDRPFFIYEIVERVNGYNGFAIKNINVLKKAEEMEIMNKL